MQLREYANARLDEDGSNAIIEGLQNNVHCNLVDAINNVPEEDWNAEISNRQKESEGLTLIWLEGRSDPSYAIQA
jgi:hypothetical protein